MSEYAVCECYACSRRVPKPEAHRVTIDRESGHSSGNFRFSRRSASFYTGRTYYRKQDIWLCNECYRLRMKRKGRHFLVGLGMVGSMVVLFLFSYLNADNQNERTRLKHVSDSSAATSAPADQAANIVRANKSPTPVANDSTAVPVDAKKAQDRLIELGFLSGPADGVWGTKSRMALRAFKIANGLAADDKWDALVSGHLYSTQAARSPLPLATTGRSAQ
jgi:Putative peptidoglycan binding domain